MLPATRLPATSQRVPEHTAEHINRWIEQQTQQRIQRLEQLGPGAINQRLAELEREWDIERTLEANAASLAFGGIILGATVDRRWLFLPAAVTGFLLQHALQGWCPPLPVFRRMGVRTAHEIENERHALLKIRDRQRGEGGSALPTNNQVETPVQTAADSGESI